MQSSLCSIDTYNILFIKWNNKQNNRGHKKQDTTIIRKERTEITWRLSIGLANSSPIGGDGWPGLLDMTLGTWEFSPYNTVSLEISPSTSVNR